MHIGPTLFAKTTWRDASPHRRATTGIAVATAAALGVASASVANHCPTPPVNTVVVEPASLATSMLDGISVVVNAAGEAINLTAQSVVGLPVEVALLAGAAVGNPAAIPNLASYLVHDYLSPDLIEGNIITLEGYPWQFDHQVVQPLAALFPPPLGPSTSSLGAVLTVTHAVEGVITAALAGLPDPGPGADAYWSVYTKNANNPIYRLAVAFADAILAPVSLMTGVASWLGQEPVRVFNAVRTALNDPADVPALLSGLVYDVLDPSSRSLVERISAPLLQVGQDLPRPLGDNWSPPYNNGSISNAYQAVADAVTQVLHAALPVPAHPTSQNSVAAASQRPSGGLTAKQPRLGTERLYPPSPDRDAAAANRMQPNQGISRPRKVASQQQLPRHTGQQHRPERTRQTDNP